MGPWEVRRGACDRCDQTRLIAAFYQSFDTACLQGLDPRLFAARRFAPPVTPTPVPTYRLWPCCLGRSRWSRQTRCRMFCRPRATATPRNTRRPSKAEVRTAEAPSRNTTATTNKPTTDHKYTTLRSTLRVLPTHNIRLRADKWVIGATTQREHRTVNPSGNSTKTAPG